jgi:hypothetical protein
MVKRKPCTVRDIKRQPRLSTCTKISLIILISDRAYNGGFLNNMVCIHRKKSFSIFLSPAGMSLTKLFLGGNNLYMTSLFPPRESLVSDIAVGNGNIEKLFLRCTVPVIEQINKQFDGMIELTEYLIQ